MSQSGVQFARNVTSRLEAKGFGHEVKEGSQYFFEINKEEVIKRLEELCLMKKVISRILESDK